jgi:hypothetical protein
MFAVVGRWKLDPEQADEQRAVLTQRIVPGVAQADGFVAGYWSEPTTDGDAHSFIVFQERDLAEPSQSACETTVRTVKPMGFRTTTLWSSG